MSAFKVGDRVVVRKGVPRFGGNVGTIKRCYPPPNKDVWIVVLDKGDEFVFDKTEIIAHAPTDDDAGKG